MLYDIILEKIDKGSGFSCDFRKKSLLVNRKYIIKNGVVCDKYSEMKLIEDSDDILGELKSLYFLYHDSIPSERSERRIQWFKAKRLEEIDSKELVYGMSRDYAQAKLELFFMFHILSGNLKWSVDWKNVCHKLCDGCVLLKQWF